MLYSWVLNLPFSVAEALFFPFGEDYNDFDIDKLLDRHMTGINIKIKAFVLDKIKKKYESE